VANADGFYCVVIDEDEEKADEPASADAAVEAVTS
jgi:hypothetical protein